MKTKLLKKIRERYAIYHYPTQYKTWDKIFKGEFYILVDTKYDYTIHVGVEIVKPQEKPQEVFQYNATDKKEALSLLMKHMSKWIRRDYYQFASRQTRRTKIWHL